VRARVRDFQPAMLDDLGALGELVWIGGGALGGDDGRVALFRRDRVLLLLDAPPVPDAFGATHRALLDTLDRQGASFFAQISASAPAGASTADVMAALWDLV
jgi:ATP-dependent Lhr-like helicase